MAWRARRRGVAVIMAILAGSAAWGQQRDDDGREARFDPRAYQSRAHGNLTEIYVLGTSHLAQQDRFDAASLSLLLDRLEAFGPDVITIEALPGRTIFLMRAYDAVFDGAAAAFAGAALEAAGLAAEALGMDMPAAEIAVHETLADWPATPSAAERRRLAALFAASGDPHSALVQWLRLAGDERVADDGVTDGLAALLDRLSQANNENVAIAAALAVRLGHERVYAADDHTAVHLMDRVAGPMGEALQSPAFADVFDHPLFTESAMEPGYWESPQALLAWYRRLNAPAYGHLDAEGQWLIMIDRQWPEDAGRIRMAEWETRNLRMAANIREASADAIGGRVLSVVGAAHKPWFDAYLELMTDMRVMDSDEVLGAAD